MRKLLAITMYYMYRGSCVVDGLTWGLQEAERDGDLRG
jgi:hypothetical protein